MPDTRSRTGLPKTLLALIPALGLSVQGATLCVNTAGNNGCYGKINDAVAAASAGDTIRVRSGTYKEAVVITKSLSLVGNGAIVDGTGLGAQGFFVNGMTTPGLSDVSISGFTIQNSSFEGILVANASSVTISSNTVTNNTTALSAGTCPGLPAFETLEQADCGEGIHFLGVDHSIISHNTSNGNSGGILLADDTGATHDNVITFNNVRENPYACGITMASHPPAQITGSATPLGVYHNTVYANRSSRNGLLNGGGAGVGMFASIPNAMTYGNVVVNNLLSENGLPGIAMHAHVPGQNLNDNVIVGNTIVDNGPDTADAATPGPTGINLYGAGPVTGTMITGNAIEGETVDIAVNTPAPVELHLNNLLGFQTGVANLGSGSVNASSNWWSCDRGPTSGSATCSGLSGTGIVSNPFLLLPVPSQPHF